MKSRLLVLLIVSVALCNARSHDWTSQEISSLLESVYSLIIELDSMMLYVDAGGEIQKDCKYLPTVL